VSPSAVSDPSRRARSGAPHPATVRRGRFVCGPRASWPPAQGGQFLATPLGWCYVTGHDQSPAQSWGRVTRDRGFPPHMQLCALETHIRISGNLKTLVVLMTDHRFGPEPSRCSVQDQSSGAKIPGNLIVGCNGSA